MIWQLSMNLGAMSQIRVVVILQSERVSQLVSASSQFALHMQYDYMHRCYVAGYWSVDQSLASVVQAIAFFTTTIKWSRSVENDIIQFKRSKWLANFICHVNYGAQLTILVVTPDCHL